jgi:hypothetical protein
MCKVSGLMMAKARPPALRDPLGQAMRNRNRMDLLYSSKKAKGQIISREIRPYEVSRGSLWATDTLHGANRIHRFLLNRIRMLNPIPGTSFQPQWPVQVPISGDIRDELQVARDRVRAAREALAEE